MNHPSGTPADNRRLILVLLAALVVLATVVITLLVRTSGDDGADADLDAEQACEVVERLPEKVTGEDLEEDLPLIHRLGAVQSLSMAAAELDDDYEALAEQTRKLMANFMHDELDSALADLRGECEGIS